MYKSIEFNLSELSILRMLVKEGYKGKTELEDKITKMIENKFKKREE